MNRNSVIYLLGNEYRQDEHKVMHAYETRRKVYASVSSIRMDEFHQAGAYGLKPQLVFTIFAPEYKDEETVEYKGRKYTIYRTYWTKDDTLELYCEARKGSGDNGSI